MPEGAGETNPLLSGQFDPLKRQVYQQVLAAAEARPEQVTVERMPQGLPGGIYGRYSPETREIQLNPPAMRPRYDVIPPTSLPSQNTLAHELLHFLGGQWHQDLNRHPGVLRQTFLERLVGLPLEGSHAGALNTTEAQHALITYLLGGSKGQSVLSEYEKEQPLTTPPPVQDTGQQRALDYALRQLFTDPALLARARAGLGHR